MMLTLANRSSIANIVKDVYDISFCKYKANAFLHWYHKYGLEKDDFENAFNVLDNIIENYNQVYPNFIYDLEFENLVNNPLEESKKLMKFCELPWDKKCLEFYKRKDLISKTASNVQIRKPIYKHSFNKYLPYKKFLNKYGEKYPWFK